MTYYPDVEVVEVENPVNVTVTSGTPVITITDLQDPAQVVEVQAGQVTATVSNHQPEVYVRVGRGNLSDRTILLEALSEAIDITNLDPVLRDDILALRDFFADLGQGLWDFMTEFDIDQIKQTAITVTDEKISLAAADIKKTTDELDVKYAELSLTAEAITAQVIDLDWRTDGTFNAQFSLVEQTAAKIESTVARLDNLYAEDGVTGLVVQMQSQITQTADAITQEVIARQALDGVVTEQSTKITQTATAIEAFASSFDEQTGRLNTATERLTATEKTVALLSRGLNDGSYSLETVMALTQGSFGVSIEETINGIPFVSGFEIILYPIWQLGMTYQAEDLQAVPEVKADYVTYTEDNLVYKCILDHTATADNGPGGTSGSTYWVQTEKERSEFNVVADSFSVINPSSGLPVPIFTIANDEVSINADLIVNTIKSDNYDTKPAGEPWFLIDSVTGQAQFNNIVMTFSSSTEQDAFVESLGLTGDTVAFEDFDPDVSIPLNADWGTAFTWDFDSSDEGGCIIELELEDGYTGDLMVALNDVLLNVDLFGETDFGDMAPVTNGFENESFVSQHRDFASGGFDYDFGGF